MQAPPKPNSLPQTPGQQKDKATTTQKQNLPTPQELITHYTDRGLEPQDASIKVIEDLQKALYRFMSSNNAQNKKDKFMAETSRKMDAVYSRMAVVDVKMDTKPGYAEAFAIGVASGATVSGIGTVWPHVFKGLGQIWSAVRTATSAKPSSSG